MEDFDVASPETPADPQFVRTTLEDDVARIVLDRGAASNALNVTLLTELVDALERISREEAVKIVVVTGTGNAFSSGFDVAEHTDDNVYLLLEAFHDAILRIASLEAVTVSVVKGMALGAGCELAVACDFCFVAEGAKLGQPEIKAGLFPSVAPVLYPRLLGLHRTFEMILTGRIYEAREAESNGLITRAIAPDQIDAESEKWVQFLRGFSTPVVKLARRAVADTVGLPLEEGLRHVSSMYLDQLMSTEDAGEGVRALRERRSPTWKHR